MIGRRFAAQSRRLFSVSRRVGRRSAVVSFLPIPRSNAAAIPLGLGNIAELSVEFVEPPESNHLHFNRFPSEGLPERWTHGYFFGMALNICLAGNEVAY